MLPTPESDPSATPERAETPDQRRRRLRQQLRARLLPLIDRMADTLADAPDAELFRSAEVGLRDLGLQAAATAHQAGLDDRKKGGT